MAFGDFGALAPFYGASGMSQGYMQGYSNYINMLRQSAMMNMQMAHANLYGNVLPQYYNARMQAMLQNANNGTLRANTGAENSFARRVQNGEFVGMSPDEIKQSPGVNPGDVDAYLSSGSVGGYGGGNVPEPPIGGYGGGAGAPPPDASMMAAPIQQQFPGGPSGPAPNVTPPPMPSAAPAPGVAMGASPGFPGNAQGNQPNVAPSPDAWTMLTQGQAPLPPAAMSPGAENPAAQALPASQPATQAQPRYFQGTPFDPNTQAPVGQQNPADMVPQFLRSRIAANFQRLQNWQPLWGSADKTQADLDRDIQTLKAWQTGNADTISKVDALVGNVQKGSGSAALLPSQIQNYTKGTSVAYNLPERDQNFGQQPVQYKNLINAMATGQNTFQGLDNNGKATTLNVDDVVGPGSQLWKDDQGGMHIVDAHGNLAAVPDIDLSPDAKAALAQKAQSTELQSARTQAVQDQDAWFQKYKGLLSQSELQNWHVQRQLALEGKLPLDQYQAAFDKIRNQHEGDVLNSEIAHNLGGAAYDFGRAGEMVGGNSQALSANKAYGEQLDKFTTKYTTDKQTVNPATGDTIISPSPLKIENGKLMVNPAFSDKAAAQKAFNDAQSGWNLLQYYKKNSSGGSSGATSPMSYQDAYDMALQAGDPHPEVAAAQAMLESQGGRHVGGANNFFGIKGPGNTANTTEVVGGKSVPTKASFQNFATPQAAFQHRLGLLNSRYPGYNAPSTGAAVQALVKGGYATDPQYGQKLMGIIQKNQGGARAASGRTPGGLQFSYKP